MMGMRAALFLSVSVVMAWVGITTRVHAAAFEVNDTSWEGASELLNLARSELGAERVAVIAHLDWSTLEPNDALLVLHPERVLASENLAAFLDRGGRAAVLDDYGVGDRILERFHIQRVPAPQRPLLALRHKPELAIAEPVREAGPAHVQALHVSVQDVERLVTNHPTGLRNDKMTPVLHIRSVDAGEVVIALAGNFGSPPRGKLFAMGDPSAVVNQMLRYPGNRAFAAGLVRYLAQEPADGGRGGRLLILTNRFGQSGSLNGVGGLGSEISARLETIAEQFDRVMRGGLAGGVGLLLAGTTALGIAIWTTSSASRPYRPRLPSFTRSVPLIAQGGLAGRAALLANDATPLALAALEVKSALEEKLAAELGFRDHVAHAVLLDEVRARRALAPVDQKKLQTLLLEFAKIETLVAAHQPVRLRRRDLLRFSRTGDDIVNAARRALREGAAA